MSYYVFVCSSNVAEADGRLRTDGCLSCGVSEKMERGCRRLVIVRDRDGAATTCHERFRTQGIMMGKYACASCASCVMMVMVMTMSCGGDEGVLLMMVM